MIGHIIYNSFYLYTDKLDVVKNLHYSMSKKCCFVITWGPPFTPPDCYIKPVLKH